MGTNWVAPDITVEQYDDSRRLEVFHSRTKQWILAHAIKVSNDKDGGIPSLIIATSVFEPIGAIRLSDKGNRERRFMAGFGYVFPKWSGISKLMYNNLRGGLFHEGFIARGLLITDLEEPIVQQNETIQVDPKRFVQAVSERFDEFCNAIKNNEDDLQSKFCAYWKPQAEGYNYSQGERKPVIDFTTAVSTGAVDTYYRSAAMPPNTTINLRTKSR
jgi:hypothetical protein